MSNLSAHDVDALKARLREKMDTLPQRDVIEESDAKQWIDYMAHVMPGEAMWHMIRAGGVGGSEIGGLVRNYMGKMADHEFSAHKWAQDKLLRRVPELARGVTERGHFMEPHIADFLYQQTGTQRDQAAFDKLSKAQGSAIWMRYSPDDVVFYHKPTSIPLVDGYREVSGRILVDYKAPTVVEQTPKISFQYACQLHQGAILCQEQDIQIDTTMLVQFDWATFSLKHDVVDINPELCDLIMLAGDHYWNEVMNGRVPAPILRQRASLDPSDYERWADAAVRLGQINAMRTELNNASDALRDQLINGLSLAEKRLDGQVLKFDGAISISGIVRIDEEKVRQALGEDKVTEVLVKEKSTKYDEAALVRRLKELGEDVKPYRKLTRMDPSLVFDALAEAGLDPEEFIAETTRIGVDKGIKEQAQDWLNQSFPPLDLPKPPTLEDEMAQALECAQEAERSDETSRPSA